MVRYQKFKVRRRAFMAGNKSRSKGKSGEREVRKLMQAVVDKAVESANLGPCGPRLVQRNLLQSDRGGPDLVGVPGMAIEVKRHATLRVPTWWEQTVRQAEQIPGHIPVLLYRPDRGKWKARIYAKLPIDREKALTMPVDLEMPEFTTWAVEYIKNRLIEEAKLVPIFGNVGNTNHDNETN